MIDHTQALFPVGQQVQALAAALRQLLAVYGEHWLALHQANDLDAAGHAALQAAIAPGRHSVLGQDTVWNALQGARQLQLALAKALVAAL